ncbi:MAG: DUF58 domain-containing protein [Sphingomonadaceae bacterium]
MALFVPTRRAAILLAVAAPVALVIGAAAPGAWTIAPIFGLAILLLVFVDALLAGRLRDVTVSEPGDVEVGATSDLLVNARFSGGAPSRCQAAIDCDARLADGGTAKFMLARRDKAWIGALPLTPSRRGTAALDRIWLRWTGPLGLGSRQKAEVLGREVRVWPNVRAVTSPTLQTFLRDAQYGLIARRIRGEGTQFESLAEYQPGMDRRRIDWKTSARHMELLAKEFETERNNQIVFAFDCGQAMCEPIEGMPRIDRAVSAALATSYIALKGGDKVALFGFAARPEVSTPFFAGSHNFFRLQRAAAGLDYHEQEPNFTLALATLAGQLKRRSLIVIFSDFTDPTSAELMKESIGRLTKRHVVLFVQMTDAELEDISHARPDDMGALAMAVTADSLLKQRELVLRELRQLGVDVIEAPHEQIGARLIDAYLKVKRSGAIG